MHAELLNDRLSSEDALTVRSWCALPACPRGRNQICIGGNQCACKPGWTGANCTSAQCVQTCANGGRCVAPDTCTCQTNWFDPNCTTPVCSVTCGNGGNCTNPGFPNPCTCPREWSGTTCREPVCAAVSCVNGGKCIAPDTCLCPVGWSGHDCSKPVCTQGFFRPDPQPVAYAPPSYATTVIRPQYWRQYMPCNFTEWCGATNEFECFQRYKHFMASVYNADRTVTGFYAWELPNPGDCFRFELALGTAVVHCS